MFNQAVTNTGIIVAQGINKNNIGLEITGTLYNLTDGNISVTTAKAVFAEVSNSGTIIAAGTDTKNIGLYVAKDIYSSGTINIAKGIANFNQAVTNTGIIVAQGINKNNIGLEVSGTLYNLIDGSISVTLGKALFAEVTNSGTIIAAGTDTKNIGLYVAKDIYSSGTINIAKGSAMFNQAVTNTGIIVAQGINKNNIGLEVSGTLYNLIDGSISVTLGKALFAEVTNSGTIIAAGTDTKNIGLDVLGTVYNTGTITITSGKLKLGQLATNYADIKVKLATILPAGATLTNHNYFSAKTFEVASTKVTPDAYFENLTDTTTTIKAVAEFTDIINESNIHIKNTGSLSLMGSSTIGSYTGDASSELVLTLPAKLATNTNLVHVIKDTTFAADARIILAVNAPHGYLTKGNSPTINIVKSRKITINGSPDNLLYSRIYDPKVSKPPVLQASSMFVHITEVTQTTSGGNDILTAKLELITSVELLEPIISDIVQKKYHSSLAKSLLNDDILQANSIRTVEEIVGQIAQRQLMKKTKQKIIPVSTKKSSTNLQQIDTSGIEYSKAAYNHLHIINNIMQDSSVISREQPTFNFINNNYNVWAAVSGYSAKDMHPQYKHNWKETLLHLGAESVVSQTKFNVSLAYLSGKMSTAYNKNTASTARKDNTNLKSYLGIAHAITSKEQWLFNAALLLAKTKHNTKQYHNKYTAEFSVAIGASYKFVVNRFNIDLGVNSFVMHISQPMHMYTAADKKIKSNKKMFASLGAFVGLSTSYKIYDTAIITTEMRTTYSYIDGVRNEDYITIINNTILKQDDIIKHKWHLSVKTNINYDNFFCKLSVNWNHNKNTKLYGGGIAVGYKL